MQKLIDKYRAELEELKEERKEVIEKQKVHATEGEWNDLCIERAELRCQMSVLFDVIIDLEREEIEKWL